MTTFDHFDDYAPDTRVITLRITVCDIFLTRGRTRITRIPPSAGEEPGPDTSSPPLRMTRIAILRKTALLSLFAHFCTVWTTFVTFAPFPRRLRWSSEQNYTFILGYSASDTLIREA